jgi:hypothetical protein
MGFFILIKKQVFKILKHILIFNMKSLNLLIAAFATLLVGIMLLGTVATQTYTVTGNSLYKTNESLNVSAGRNSDSNFMNESVAFTLTNKGVQCGNGEGRWVSGSVVICNASGSILMPGNYTVNYGNNSITFKNTTTTDILCLQTAGTGAGFFNGSNITSVNYSYYPKDYLCESWNRTALNLIPGFFGIAVLLISVALFYQIAKEEGIFGKV